jgi:glycosyltransferase involved in cell wall biosynthesis
MVSTAMRTGFLAAQDATRPGGWSGTPFHMLRALERHLGTVSQVGPMPAWPRRLLAVQARAATAIGGGRGLPGHARTLSYLYGRIAQGRLSALSPAADLVFSPAGSPLLAHLRTRLPVVYSSDTTARLLLDYYPQFTGLSRRAIRNAEDLERAAIARADLLLYPTRWAADSAIADYGADPDRIRVIPYGANLRESPQDPGVRDVAPGAPCRLLLVGANWAIKGGEIAIDTLAALRARGIEAELTVVGSAPEARRQMPGLTFIPFLDKNRAEDRARLDALYRAADFFILPSRCECYGIVFCEAAAYGLPALASRTGGIPEVVREGETGYTLPLSADGAAYADRIMALRADPDGYRALRAASRRAFESLLNWDSWGRAAAEAVREMLGRLESRKA